MHSFSTSVFGTDSVDIENYIESFYKTSQIDDTYSFADVKRYKDRSKTYTFVIAACY